MEYMFLITMDDEAMAEPATADPVSGSDAMAAWLAYNQKLIDGGHWISGGSLQSSASTTVVHKDAVGGTSTTDGPYTESKEQVAGYYTVTAADLDEALALAAEIPVQGAAIEVRPLMWRPDA
ncbi:MAG: YCII-related [Nocardioidaceae bacterium]|nr:YCII-related [Nocardioidaceae bacterium]